MMSLESDSYETMIVEEREHDKWAEHTKEIDHLYVSDSGADWK
jgi:hypothetical protein